MRRMLSALNVYLYCERSTIPQGKKPGRYPREGVRDIPAACDEYC